MNMESKDLILIAAISVFAEFGKKSSSMAMIAKKANVSKPLVFHHFSTKDKLFEDAFSYAMKAIESIKHQFMTENVNFFEKIYHVQIAKYELEQKIPRIFQFILLNVPQTPSLPNYPFTPSDLALFKDGIDPQFIYQILYVLSLGFSQLLKDGMPWKDVYDDYAKTFELIKKMAMKGASFE